MKILVTGASGQLGYDVCRELERRGTNYLGTTSASMDITMRDAVLSAIVSYQPNAVIHCAAYTAVDQAEEEPDRAFLVNETGTRNIAEACRKVGAKMLYVSTDYVFPGDGMEPYETDAPTEPLNVYGKSKLAGELAIQEMLDAFFIVRTSWIFGHHGRNFVKTMLQLSESMETIPVVDDQVGTPTYTADLASLLCDIVETDRYGVYHGTNEGFCSWAEFAKEIFGLAGRKAVVEPISTAAYTTGKAIRPLNSRLSKVSLTKARFMTLPHWRIALKQFLRETQV